MSEEKKIIKEFTSKEYEHGWSVKFDVDEAPIGINEDIIRLISKKKKEPKWLLKWRLDAFKIFLKMKEPDWGNLQYPKIDFQKIKYYSAPKQKKTPKSIEDVATELIKTFNCGLGMILVVPKKEKEKVMSHFNKNKQPILEVGEVTSDKTITFI